MKDSLCFGLGLQGQGCGLVLVLEGPGLGLEGPGLGFGLDGPGLGLGLQGPGLGLRILTLTTSLVDSDIVLHVCLRFIAILYNYSNLQPCQDLVSNWRSPNLFH
jgi:hypothetical protein